LSDARGIDFKHPTRRLGIDQASGISQHGSCTRDRKRIVAARIEDQNGNANFSFLNLVDHFTFFYRIARHDSLLCVGDRR